MQNLVIGALVGVFVAAVIGIPAYFRRRKDDSVSVTGTLTQASELAIINAIGCAGLLLTVSGKGKRPAKITGASLCLRGFNALPAFQEGFDTDFGCIPAPGSVPVFIIDLVPVSRPNSDEGWVLERDDICKFVLPIQCPFLPQFADAPSQDVTIQVAFFDGSKHVVLQGFPIQTEIKSLIEVWGQTRQTLKAELKVRIEMTTSAPPDVAALGTTNPKPVIFGDGISSNESPEGDAP